MTQRFQATLFALICGGCVSLPTSNEELANQFGKDFKAVEKSREEMASKEDLALIEEAENPIYLFGSGDVVRIDVTGRPEVSTRQVVGPDGVITIPLIGDVFVNGMTRDEAHKVIHTRLLDYFTHPHLTIAVEDYVSNQVTVLGRVATAGRQRFAHPPTLAEVLANAGALPILDKQATLTRCAIMRGRDKLIWVDLKALLTGDPAYNIRMKKGDIIFIPDSSDTAVYVMGSVLKPGSLRLTPRMTILDALAQSGGPSEDAAPDKIGIYRAGAKQVEIIDFGSIVAPDRKINYALEDGDVIFVPKSGLASFGYLVRQISPLISVLTFGLTASAAVTKKE
ncbi:MAG: polysaccharide biosynthesis/export family protein [Rhodocyclaceae bacterium]|nr:polysaccharide biosynthesis/export family protein [Rhodocyclaceae bacterium]MDZ4216478.1 polysaccharide biosynthesis/export family protein [Rhodocyclaceae bacterium]